MSGYVRNDTANNIADGNIISASDLDGEFDAIQAAFLNTTGHTHDGTAAEGSPITKIGPTQDVVASATELKPKTTNVVDLGTSSLKFKNIYSSGTSYLTTLDLTNVLAIADGGTGAGTFTANNVLLGNGTSAFQTVAPGTSGNVLTSNGTTWASVTPKPVPTGDIVGTTDTQTLTNKTISADNNTISGIAASSFVLSNASGNLDGAASQKAIPTGVVVGTTDTQTLTNKTISADNNTISGIAASSFVLSDVSGNLDGAASQKAIPTGVVVGTTDTQTLTNKTVSGLTINDGYTEEVFAVSGTTPALSPTNGSIQTWTLTGNSTPTAGTWAAGQSLTLMIDDGTAYTITWTSLAVTWKTNAGSAPALNTTGFTAIQLWKVGAVIYGARVGDA